MQNTLPFAVDKGVLKPYPPWQNAVKFCNEKEVSWNGKTAARPSPCWKEDLNHISLKWVQSDLKMECFQLIYEELSKVTNDLFIVLEFLWLTKRKLLHTLCSSKRWHQTLGNTKNKKRNRKDYLGFLKGEFKLS